MSENRREMEFQLDLWKLLQVYLRKWWIIALFALLSAGGMLFYTANFITPQYRASVTIYVNNTNRNNETLDYVSGSDLSTSQRLVSTYTNMLTSDTVLEQVIEATGQHFTPDGLRGMISAEQVGDTEIFKVNVRHTDPKAAAQIANAIAETAPDVIADFVEGSSTKIIDYAKMPTGRFTPSYKKNTVTGFIIGAAIAVALLTLQFLLDVRIKDENDLSDLFDIPVLGQIPDLNHGSSKGSYSVYKKYADYVNSADQSIDSVEEAESKGEEK